MAKQFPSATAGHSKGYLAPQSRRSPGAHTLQSISNFFTFPISLQANTRPPPDSGTALLRRRMEALAKHVSVFCVCLPACPSIETHLLALDAIERPEDEDDYSFLVPRALSETSDRGCVASVWDEAVGCQVLRTRSLYSSSSRM